MGKFETKKEGSSRRETILTVSCIVMAVVIAVLIFLLWHQGSNQPEVSVYEQGQSTQEPSTSLQALSVGESDVQGDDVLVQTSYCTLKYPAAFFDVIQVSEGDGAIVFSARLGETVCPMYTIYFSDEGDMPIGTMKLPEQAEPIGLTVTFHEPIDGLKEDELFTFNAARDTFSEVWFSLSDNEGFTPID